MVLSPRYISSLAAGGGAGTSEGDPWTWAEWLANAVSGLRGWVKKDGVYATTGNQAFTNAGDGTRPIYTCGYETVIGDGGVPQIDLDNGSSFLVDKAGHSVSTLFVSGNVGYTGVIRPSSGRVYSCKAVNVNADGFGLHLQSGGFAHGCYSDGGSGAYIQDPSCQLLASRVKCGAGVGLVLLRGLVDGCIFDGGDQAGLSHCVEQGAGIISNCAIYTAANNGIVQTGSAPAFIQNVALWGVSSSGTGVSWDGAATNKDDLYIAKLAIGGFATRDSLGDIVEDGAITLTADPFTDAANGDFSRNETAGGGALLENAALVPPQEY